MCIHVSLQNNNLLLSVANCFPKHRQTNALSQNFTQAMVLLQHAFLATYISFWVNVPHGITSLGFLHIFCNRIGLSLILVSCSF